MIRLEAIESVPIRERHLFTADELNAALLEGDRFLDLLPTLPKNVPYRVIANILRENEFFIMPVIDDDRGKWVGFRNVVEVFSTTISDKLPGIYIVAIMTTIFTDIPSGLGNGDKIYKGS